MSRLRLLPLLALLVTACRPDEPDEDEEGPPPPPLVEGTPLAGAASGTLRLPMGTPLAAFTARCGCLGGISRQDSRKSNYARAFVPSTGVHLRPSIKAVWLSNGDKHLVMTKVDLGYAFDGIVGEVTKRLEEATGEELDGMVTFSTNHTHSSYGTFSANEGFFLGSDKFNRENFERIVQQIVDVALEAYASREPAALGFGAAKNWDPDDRIYSDRRGENDDLKPLFDDLTAEEQNGKDPYMHLLRIDRADDPDSPIAVVFGWGMHPYTFGEWSSLATGDATAAIEIEVEESFEKPTVAMFLQTSAGDASVRGSGPDWVRSEVVAALATPEILALREETPTSADPILLETYSSSVPTTGDAIHVKRFGKVDWKYPKWDPEKAETWKPDNIVYNEDGSLRGDFDEFYTGYGAVFCGSGDFDLPVGGLPNIDAARAPEYRYCMQISFMKLLVESFFFEPGEVLDLPLDGMAETFVAATRFGPVGVRKADGTTGVDDVYLSFFPGEPVHIFSETWRHYMRDELDIENTALIGYSMDHEGYLLTAEDWLQGGYEPDISLWGPLGAEWIMENVLDIVQKVLKTDLAEPFDPKKGVWKYKDAPFPNLIPDLTPDAGTLLTNADIAELDPILYWVPKQFRVDIDLPETVRRLQDVIQVGWIGGDPAVDDPRIFLEREVEPGRFEPVTSHTGRPIDDQGKDFVIGWTPDPLFPATAPQVHRWWAAWQAIGPVADRTGLPAGTYRIRIEGAKFAGNDTEFPWDSVPYTIVTDPFEVVPADITVESGEGGVWAFVEGPREGFRLIDLEGHPNGANPLRGELTVTWYGDDEPYVETIQAPAAQNGKTFLPFPDGPAPTGAVIVNVHGDRGRWGEIPAETED